jgi:3(or 17)beta-hydroxysteroid dehydrogenase
MGETLMSRLIGKIAIVTGAGSGLGKAISETFAEEGARVVLTDIDLESATRVAETIGSNAMALHQDVFDEQRWNAIFEATVDSFGNPHILVNNAGLVIPATIEDCTLEQFRKQNAVMLDGVFLGCRTAVRAMKSNDQPSSIINLSSMAALQCKEQNYPIRCNSLHPAGIDTPMVRQEAVGAEGGTTPATGMIPIGDLGHPRDVAALCVYLASDESRFMTAGEYPVDNGVLYQPA